MFIGIAGTIPNLPNLPGQGGGGGVEVLLEYDSSSFCKVTNPNLISPTVAEPAGGTFSYTGTGTLGIVPSTGLINISASDSGSYTITYSVGGASSSFPIAIGNEIILSITTSPGTTICTGDTATLTANASGGSGGFTYSWNTSPPQTTQSIDVTTSGNYTVTVTDSDGCSVSAVQQITVSTAATAIASINNDAAMSFNGTDTYVGVNDYVFGGLTELTVSCWYNLNTISGDQAIVAKWVESLGILLYHDNPNGWRLLLKLTSGTNATLQSTFVATPNTWQHLAVTWRSGDKVRIYLNGTNVQESTSNYTGTTATVSDFNIGRDALTGANTRYLNGKLDELAVWDSALSSCDVKGIYDATTTVNGQPKSANLLDANTTIPAPVYWNRMGDS